MRGTLPPTDPRPQTGPATPAAPPLTQSYDPPLRGPVLLATDGRSATDATVRAAQVVAERLGTTVEVVGVLEPYPSYWMDPEIPILPPDVEAERRTAIGAAIGGRLMALGAGAETWPIVIHYGDPARTIVDTAHERDSTLIVVGAGRYEPRDRLFGGARALHVVRGADRPVLVVRSDFAGPPKTAVVGMDFSPASVRAARAALMLLAAEGRLVLVHVRPVIDLPTVPPTTIVGDTSFDLLVSRWRTGAEAENARLFEALRDELRPYVPAGVSVETRVRTGVVLRELLGVADEVGADLLAVGTHGHGVLERFFLGSVAGDAVREAGRTVLVAPTPGPTESARLELRLRGTAELKRSSDWETALEAFTTRNAGRRVRLEVDDPDLGAQVQESGFAFLGATFDRRDHRVELMMGDPADRTQHLTRTMPRVDDVAFYATPDGRERALRVASGRGQTLLTFLD